MKGQSEKTFIIIKDKVVNIQTPYDKDVNL